MTKRIRLGVNIDHVATLRNARGGVRPDPVRAACLAVEAGADGITAHLREDRRHIRDVDIELLKKNVPAPLNFEMAPTAEMVAIAKKVKPHAACLVPEKREERTTEGGLDLSAASQNLRSVIDDLSDSGIRVSLFIEPDPQAVRRAAELRAPVIELHTGAWCGAIAVGDNSRADEELKRLKAAAELASRLGLEVHAGHGLDYASARKLASAGLFREFNIGHFLIGEAVFMGIEKSIRAMRDAIDAGQAERE